MKGKMPFKMHKIMLFFSEKKMLKKIYVPTLPKMFKTVTRKPLFWPYLHFDSFF